MLEEDIKRLEEISNSIDNSQSLDQSLNLYEEACKLAKKCLDELNKAKGKITMIKKEFNKKDEDNDG